MRADDPVDSEVLAHLEGVHGSMRFWPEDPIHDDGVSAGSPNSSDPLLPETHPVDLAVEEHPGQATDQ